MSRPPRFTRINPPPPARPREPIIWKWKTADLGPYRQLMREYEQRMLDHLMLPTEMIRPEQFVVSPSTYKDLLKFYYGMPIAPISAKGYIMPLLDDEEKKK